VRQVKTDPSQGGSYGSAVGEPVGVAIEGDDVGVVDESVDDGGGDDLAGVDVAQRLKAQFEVTMVAAVSHSGTRPG
jgi:hypothetical protein